MLDFISLRNFKSARDLRVPLGHLTVLSGLNGSGKSTVLQAMCIARQSIPQPGSSAAIDALRLRGRLVQLGTARDILSDRAADNTIEISLSVGGISFGWSTEAQTAVDVDTLPVRDYLGKTHVGVDFFRGRTFQFLQADRLTPATHYELDDTDTEEPGPLGVRGQYTPAFLARNGDRLEVSPRRRCPEGTDVVPKGLADRIVSTPKLYDQTCGWLQYLSPGVRLRADRLLQTDLVSLRFAYASSEIAQDSQQRRPSNVGFGLTYSLPIVVAALAAPSGSLLLLENPEAHLHPRGQAALGTLLAKAAADNVQIIVETHSDHILNGIRLAVRHREIDATTVRICNFTREPVTGDTYVELPTILPTGELSAWPVGFFDEWEKSLEALLR